MLLMGFEDNFKNGKEEGVEWTLEKLKTELKLGNYLDNAQKTSLRNVVTIQRALRIGDSDIDKTRVIPHHFELTANTPIWQRL